MFSDCKYLDDMFLLLYVFSFYMFYVYIIPVCLVLLSCQQYCTVRHFDPCEDLDISFFPPFLSPNLSHISIFVHLQCINVQCESRMNNCSQSTSDMTHCHTHVVYINLQSFCKHECVMHIALMKYNTYHLYTPK